MVTIISVGVAQRNSAGLAIPMSRRPIRSRSNGAHNNRSWPNSTQKTSLMGEDCPYLYVALPHHQFPMWDYNCLTQPKRLA
jgi:hypothetical protein